MTLQDASPGERPSARTRAFAGALVLLAAGFGSAIRWRLQSATPLPTDRPALWFLLGLAQDLAATSAAALLALLLARRAGFEGRARALLAAFFVGSVALHFVWSEVVVFFGQIPRWEDAVRGANPTFLLGSAEGPVLRSFALFVGGAVLVSAGAALLARRATAGVVSAKGFLALCLCSAAAALVMPRPERAETARHPVLALGAALAERLGLAAGSSSRTAPGLPDAAIREILAPRPGEDFLDDRFPLARRPGPRSPSAPRLPEGLKANVVFFVMEGVRAAEIGACGGIPRGLTPQLDRIAAEGIRVDRAYSNGMHTPEGELGLWYGLLPDPYSLVLADKPATVLTGLPDLLKQAGWRTMAWLHSGDLSFYRRDRFYPPRGFTVLSAADFSPGDPRTNWGYSDRALVRRAVAILDRAQEPFAAMVLTVSNHYPFQVPSDAGDRVEWTPSERQGFVRRKGGAEDLSEHLVPMLETVHYTDEAAGDLIRLARERPWFSRTIFVFTGDHGLSFAHVRRDMTPELWEEARHRVPLFFYSPLLPEGLVLPGPASHVDVMPTLLGLLDPAAARPGAGSDLFSAEEDPGRPVVTWSAEAQTVSVLTRDRVYRAVVPREAAGQGKAPRILRETLVAPLADPRGDRNLASSEPGTAERLRREAMIYLRVYPWLLNGGRSGAPPP